MSKYESQLEVSWKAYVAMLQTAEALVEHGKYVEDLFIPAKTHQEQVEVSESLANGRGCPHGYSREAAAVFCAFAFEAYLNHLGELEHPCWQQLEKLSWEGKLAVLAERLGREIDYGKRPFQTMKELFKRRNRHAHGRSLELKETIPHQKPLPIDHALTLVDWARLDHHEASRFLNDTKGAITALNQSRKNPDEFLFSGFSASTTTTLQLGQSIPRDFSS